MSTTTINAMAYITKRQRAWQARLSGDIAEANHHEAEADYMGGVRHDLVDECDDLACNPGTTDDDWKRLERTV